MSQLKKLSELGQSVWLDYIRRSLITSGDLKRLINDDDLRGVTSNPAIFEKAITGSTDYADILSSLPAEHTDPMAVYETIAIRDIQDAADALSAVYQKTGRRDGYVSLEVSPYLARDTDASVREARRLWKAVNRENVMIKVPATPEGIPAIEILISEEINVNVTLIFSQAVYEQVAEAYIAGLQNLESRGGNLSKVGSVASFFVSRIDSAVDDALQTRKEATAGPSERDAIDALLGKAAIANAKLAYQRYRQKFSGPKWDMLASQGAQTQRILWASTSTKNPSYPDTMYVEELIGPDTVNTIPPATFEAFRDRGKVRASLEEGIDEARHTMELLENLGTSFDQITDRLLDNGLNQFSEAFDKLLRSVDSRCRCETDVRAALPSGSLPDELETAVDQILADWTTNGKVRRLWARDASLWTNADESKWLGWLGLAEDHADYLDELKRLAGEIQKAGFTHVLLLGMGGSSLCPDVLKNAFGRTEGFPELIVLDSTDPRQIRAAEEQIDLTRTLFVVSSKSGSTLEPNIFKQYFAERVGEVLGEKNSGSHFMAVTDPGSSLEAMARTDGFRHICFGVPSVGGRYSALSNFGMVPAALMGIDVGMLLDRAEEMAVACSPCVPVQDNPGVVLGAMLGAAANSGRDKVTLVASPAMRAFGAWLEQLLAESTGKTGKGLIPVDREELGAPGVYGQDRLFVYLRLESEPDTAQDETVAVLEKAGHPVIRLSVRDLYDLGREFFRWEMATAVAASIIGVNPFDQPDVEASKAATRRLTDAYENKGALPDEKPFFRQRGIELFAHEAVVATLEKAAGSDKSLSALLGAHLQQLRPNDYFAILAYLEMRADHERHLQEIRHGVRDHHHVATCLGFGPRFLHSTGQAYKGGPDTGVFLQITCDEATDLEVPGRTYTFGLVKAAQAGGDFRVLQERERPVLRVHLPKDVGAGLATLKRAVAEAMTGNFPVTKEN